MNNILLILVILYLAVCVWNGHRKGLIRMVFSMIALFAAIILTKMVSPQVEIYLQEKTSVYEQIQEKTASYVEDTIGEKLAAAGLGGTSDQAYAIEELPLPKYLRTMLTKNNTSEIYGKLGVSAFEEYISSSLAQFIITALSFVLTFIVIGIAVHLAATLLNMIAKLPGINGLNRMAGAAVGFLQGMLILWVLCLGVTAAAGTELGQNILRMIEESQILSMIYNNNYLMRWILGLMELL